ncbi:hypothetical protein MP228_010096 [Amoeboaphelidium protococcarum]|nr:hypothetical protein MP228_010096 [Amoeboaphelidium protococcarum]
MKPEDWKLSDIPDLSDKYVIVTGASVKGLGYYTALELARKGANVLLAVRSEKKGVEAVDEMKKAIGNVDKVQVGSLDLASLDSVRQFVTDVSEKHKYPRVDILVNNAGVVAGSTREQTKDGFELTIGTNHLGHFALTGLLLPLLKKSDAPRVVNVSSLAHQNGKIDFEDFQSEKSYSLWPVYSNSKLANILFTKELQRRAAESQDLKKLVVCSVHPGVSLTNLGRNASFWQIILISPFIPFMQGADNGALPSIYAAVDDGAQPGEYYGPNGFKEFRGNGVIVAKTAPVGQDMEVAKKLWNLSEELTKVKFEI